LTDKSPGGLKPDDLQGMYRLMLQGRKFTLRALELYAAGRLPTGLHPSAGQEAVGVGACYGLRSTDKVVPALRTTDAFWTRGVTMLQMLNAMYGNADSRSGGKESFHHTGYPELGILLTTAMVGSQIPIAVGAAVGQKLAGSDDVTVCFFGDGATGRGDFHEGLNLAAVRKAPVVFICENNLHFQTAPVSAGAAVEDIADRAAGYGMPGVVVDGQDVVAVNEVVQEAVARARRGEGPTLVECKTYRFEKHYPFLRETRPTEEIERWTNRDPVVILADMLLAEGLITDSVVAQISDTIETELEAAVLKAESTPPPDPARAFTHVYAESSEGAGS